MHHDPNANAKIKVEEDLEDFMEYLHTFDPTWPKEKKDNFTWPIPSSTSARRAIKLEEPLEFTYKRLGDCSFEEFMQALNLMESLTQVHLSGAIALRYEQEVRFPDNDQSS
jgi:hypothetical protein